MNNNNVFNGGNNIGSGNTIVRNQNINNINNFYGDNRDKQIVAEYEVEPLWRSPITMAVLTWISFIPTIGSIFSVFKVFEPIYEIVSKDWDYTISNSEYQPLYALLLIVSLMTLSLVLYLRKIVKNQIRYPLKFGYALSGKDNRLNIEKIQSANCSICNGKMKFYNRPTKYDTVINENGKKKIIVIEKTPALECFRNSKHWCEIDPAEDKI
ncbi:hypothetical protein ACMZ6Z_07605 [Streptococcus pluranimalium]|uniref:hypothetical protein n=1 Tax=Streptococcus pluranimalium TaxID=82348 RepID=UPI0039FD5A11